MAAPMRRRNRLAWKLSVAVLAIVAVVILGTGLVGNRLSRKYSLEAARSIMQFNAESIVSGIDELMMSGNNEGALDFIAEMSHRSTTYHDISLVSHPAGEIAVSRLQIPGTQLDIGDRSCRLCHVIDDLADTALNARAEVAVGSSGNRILHVVTPLRNEPGCRNAACHVHAESGPVLGILRTEYSLASFDDLMRDLHRLLAMAALVAICLAIGVSLVMFRWILAQPLRRLVVGISTMAAGNLDFRFPAVGDDEIGLVEDEFNDMADQIQAHQRELQRARDYLEGIVENSADLIITVNTKGFIQTFNRGAEKTLGYQRMEVIGQRVEILFADPQERDVAIAKLQGQDSVANWETRFKTKDGEIRYVLLTLSRLWNRTGDLIGTLGISKDITIEKELQRKLIQAEQAAAIGRAVTAIQHAVKNMLNTLRGGLYIVRVGQKNDQQQRIREGCDMIEVGLARISDLSLSMLKYAREWKIEPESIDLTDLVGQIVVATSHTAQERSVAIRTEVDDSLPEVACDPRLIHMVLMDIVSNALDACDLKDYTAGETPEIVIRVSLTQKRRGAVIEIQDNGAGMTQEVLENVFTPFFSTKKKWGTGLGLALTSRIIDLHDGKITVESEPDQGALFRITLPLNT